MSKDWCADVLEFHAKLAPQVPRLLPEVPPARTEESYCLGFMREELEEIEDAMLKGDLPNVADGLADLIYVAIRAALIWGIDLRPVWDEVHRANMAKEGGPRRADNKILKPDGWQRPDVAGVLAAQSPLVVE
jgi:NTP pyrophosphatase (non-canonical NTP hydrolase)